MHRDAFQENHLAIDDDVASSRLDGAEADRVGHAIGARLEDDLVQPRGTGCQRSCSGTSVADTVKRSLGVTSRDHPSSAISRRAEVGTSPSTLTSPTSEPSAAMVSHALEMNVLGTLTRSTLRWRPPKLNQSVRIAGTRSGLRMQSTSTTSECSPTPMRPVTSTANGP